MAEYEQHAADLVEAMKERHAAELRDPGALLQRQARPVLARTIEFEKDQEHLARQKDYTRPTKIEAGRMPWRAWELEKWQ